MSNFLNELKNQAVLTKTENGAFAYSTTHSALLDFFSEAGALRNRHENKIINVFKKAFKESPLLAMKCLFYYRDIRQGQGERRLFREIIKNLAQTNPEVMELNLELIPEYGRYDDLLVLLDTPLKESVLMLISKQLKLDISTDSPSLLAKWLPGCDTSSKESKRYAHMVRKYLGMTEKEYRRMLSFLRERIRVTERFISTNRWSEIDLEKLTANNYVKYSNAFNNHIPNKWNEYIQDIQLGKASVKSATLYPYEIVSRVHNASKDEVILLNEMWKELPDYTDGQIENALCMVDVSGSMTVNVSGSVTAMDVAMSLGLYVSERVRGSFKNHFMTFSESPQIVKVKGSTLSKKVENMSKEDWGYNTDLYKAFKLILNTALEMNATQEDMPKKLIIISDMQFDTAIERNRKTLFNNIKKEFEIYGYSMPTVVFWNVNSRTTAFQVNKDDKNVLLCSGCSPVVLRGVLKYNNPMELVLETINSPRYNAVRV